MVFNHFMIKLKPEPILNDDRITSASGMLYVDNCLFLVCDDTDGFYIWDKNINKWNLKLCDDVSSSKRSLQELKKTKPDYECIMPCPWNEKEIWALSSGSTSIRNFRLSLNLESCEIKKKNNDDFYRNLNRLSPSINLEGAAINRGDIYFFNRGNNIDKSELFKFNDQLSYLDHWSVELPSIDGYSSHGTEICFSKNRLFILFCSENTNNSYDDGEILGSGIVEYCLETRTILRHQLFDLKIKPEGLVFFDDQWLICTDPDGNGTSQFFSLSF